jgi:hypothetical protein
MQNQNMSVEQSYRTLVIIWAALLMSQLLFLVLIYFVKPEVYKFDFSQPLLGKEPALVFILGVMSIADFVASLVLRRKYLKQAVAEQNIGLVQTAMIVGCALCEAISLFGLLLVFLQGYQYFFAFFALAILGMILHFPRRDSVIAASYKG